MSVHSGSHSFRLILVHLFLFSFLDFLARRPNKRKVNTFLVESGYLIIFADRPVAPAVLIQFHFAVATSAGIDLFPSQMPWMSLYLFIVAQIL